MKKSKLYKMNFNEAVEILAEENEQITTVEILIDYAKTEIDEGYISLAIHILSAINFSDATYFAYDYNMGILEQPTPLLTVEDLEDYCDNEL